MKDKNDLGQEDYNEGNKLTFTVGMKLLCSQAPT